MTLRGSQMGSPCGPLPVTNVKARVPEAGTGSVTCYFMSSPEQIRTAATAGLLLVDTLSTQWGCFAPHDKDGKIVWAMCAY